MQNHSKKSDDTNTFREFVVDNSDLTLNEIVGQEEAISKLRELIDAIKYNEIYGAWRNPVPKGYLLTGPTGVGKTASIRALASELMDDVCLFELKYSDVESKFIGHQIEMLRDFFGMVEEKARERHVILFVDEIDSMIPSRDSSHMQERTLERINLWLEWLDGGFDSLKNVTILGATNKPENMDEAARRSGRFDLKIKYNALTKAAIRTGVETYFRKRNLSEDQLDEIDYNHIENNIEDGDLCGADLPEVVNRLVREKITEHIENLKSANYKHLDLSERRALVAMPDCLPAPIDTDDVLRTMKNISKDNNPTGKVTMGFAM